MMEKSMRAIVQAKDDGETVQCYIRNLNNWETEMKQKEAALKDEQAHQPIPPVRTKLRKDKYKKKNNRKRPASSDQAWEVFDPNKSYEDMEDVGPLSLTLDFKQSEIFKQMQIKEEAQYQKERGNKFVKVERWDDAIACYNRAIQLVKDDAIYYANRGLCYLKKDSLHQAEQDCSEALRLDPKYVKALQRRATARERLGSLRAATADLVEVIKLEPNNSAARRQLDSIKQRMGTKGRKAKSSPAAKQSSTLATSLATKLNTSQTQKTVPQEPRSKVETQDTPQNGPQPKADAKTNQGPHGKIFGVPQASQIDLDIQPTPIKKVEVTDGANVANWKEGVGENVLVVNPVKKPPHLRSKRPLKTIPIREIPIGKTVEDTEKPATRMNIIEIEQSEGDTNNNEDKETDNAKKVEKPKETAIVEKPTETGVVEKPKQITVVDKPTETMTSSEKPTETLDNSLNNGLVKDAENNLKKNDVNENAMVGGNLVNAAKSDMMAPTNSVQFMSQWRNLRGDDHARCEYLRLLEPSNIPKVFANALESAVLSEIIQVLYNYKGSFRPRITDYLKGLARVKRLAALVMFLASTDKELLNKLLVHCKTAEDCSDADITELKNKYEL